MNEAVYPELVTPQFKALVNQCIHCGLCLQACPTYDVFGTEMDAPRGRIALMRAASEGRIAPEEFGATFSRHINLCLSCLSCQTACPSGVKYAQADRDHQGRARTASQAGRGRAPRALGRAQADDAPRGPAEGRWPACSRSTRQRACRSVVRRLRFLPRPLEAAEAILPADLQPKYRDYSRPAPAMGEKRGEVAFFIGCIQEAFLNVRQRGDDPRAAAQRLRGSLPGRPDLLRRGPAPHRRRRRWRGSWPAGTSTRSSATTSSSTTRAAAARRSRTSTRTCSATIPVYAEKARVFGRQGQGHQRVPARQPARACRPASSRCASPIPTPAICAMRRRSCRQPRALLTADPRARTRRAAPARPLLRQRRRLQHRPLGDCRPGAGREDGRHQGDRRRDRSSRATPAATCSSSPACAGRAERQRTDVGDARRRAARHVVRQRGRRGA